MKSTYSYRSRVPSPIQPMRQHPVKEMRKRMNDTQDTEHPVRKELRRLCQSPLSLKVSFSEDNSAHSTVKIPGLLAVRCVISDSTDKPLGIGYSSAYLSRLNRQQERTLFSCLNGSLLSGMNAVCKSLDALRLEKSDEERDADKMLGEAYRIRDAAAAQEPATDRQKQYLREIASRMDESQAENLIASLDEMTKSEASSAISRWA